MRRPLGRMAAALQWWTYPAHVVAVRAVNNNDFVQEGC